MNTKFSTRERVLLGVFVVILLGVAYYFTIFRSTQSRIDSLNSQISSAQETYDAAQEKRQKLTLMEGTIENFKAQGYAERTIPSYDNLSNVMTMLNGIMAAADYYDLSFDSLDTSTVSGKTLRGVDLTFGCNSYETVRSIFNNLQYGTYPCCIDSYTIKNNTITLSSSTSSSLAGSGSSGTKSNFAVTAHVTFYESGDGTITNKSSSSSTESSSTSSGS